MTNNKSKQNNIRGNKIPQPPTTSCPTMKLPKQVRSVGGQRFSITNLGPSNGYTVGKSGSTELILEKTERFVSVKAAKAAAGPPVVLTGAFKAEEFNFHPGSSNLAWLQNMSNSFSSYSVLALEFTYVPSVPTTTTGAMSIAFYEDPLDATPADMGQILTSEQALFCPVYAGTDGGTYLQRFGSPPGNVVSFNVPKRCIMDERNTPRNFKVAKGSTVTSMKASGTLSDLSSVQLYSPGKLVVATEGCPDDLTVGAVFVRYRIKLMGAVSISNQQ